MAERLIDAEELVGRLDDPALAVLEVAFQPDDGPFRAAHVPGSRWVWWKDLCWHETDREFAEPDVLARRLGRLGISERQTIVLVGDPIQFATYALWVLHLRGRRDVRVLDGGREGWLAAGLPTEAGASAPEPVEHVPLDGGDESSRIGRDGVLAAIGRDDRVILDLRSPEEYRGERVSPPTAPFDHGAERKGHVPGARHLYYQRLLGPDGRFLPTDELRRELASVGVADGEPVIAYCRLSHRATLCWFALTELLGHRDVKVYDGSWTEWGSIVGVPIER